MKDKNIKTLAGGWNGEKVYGREIFSELVFDYLEELSQEILKNPKTVHWPEAAAFAFWCRRRKLESWKNEISASECRKGRGIAFHAAPSNIPMLFAYSMAYGMIAGNGNLIRVSTRISEEAKPLCEVIDLVLQRDKYRKLYKENLIFTYEHDDELNQYFSGICNARILWGGDAVILKFRKAEVAPGCVQLEFSDRYSVALIEEDWLAELSERELEQAAERFYNDTYQADQNACSSPKLIFWIRGKAASDVKHLWWEMVAKVSRKYPLDEMRANEKYAQLCRALMDYDEIEAAEFKDNYLYEIQLKECKVPIERYRGTFGIFYEYELKEKEELLMYLDRKVQTIVYGGTDADGIRFMIRNGNAHGGDRVTAIGEALYLDKYWDGIDVIRTLSRVIG